MGVSEDEISALGREATVLKKAGQLDEAAALLEKQRGILVRSAMHYPMSTWVRLPLVLQQAGRMPEAMATFQWLLNDLPRRARKESFLDEPEVFTAESTPKISIYHHVFGYACTAIGQAILLAEEREERARRRAETKQRDRAS